MKLSLHRQSNGYSKRRFFFASMGSSLALPAGDYEIWCVGAGAAGQSTADAGSYRSGGAGGVGIKRISTTATHYIYISGGNVYFGPNNSSSGALASGLAASGATGGSGTGDEVYAGGNGASGVVGGAGCMGGNSVSGTTGGVACGGVASPGSNGGAAFSGNGGVSYIGVSGTPTSAQVIGRGGCEWWTPFDFVGFPETPSGAYGPSSSINNAPPAFPGCGGAAGFAQGSQYIIPTTGGLMAGGGAFSGSSADKAAAAGPGGGGGASLYSGSGFGGAGGQAFAIIYSN